MQFTNSFSLFLSNAEDGHPVLSLMSSVFNQASARNYYQPATAGLGYSLSIGTRCGSAVSIAYIDCLSTLLVIYAHCLFFNSGVGLNFIGYTFKLPDFAALVSQDIGDLSFWSTIHPSVLKNSKDRLLRTLR